MGSYLRSIFFLIILVSSIIIYPWGNWCTVSSMHPYQALFSPALLSAHQHMNPAFHYYVNVLKLNHQGTWNRSNGRYSTSIKLCCIRRSIRWRRMSLVYSGWPCMPIIWSPYLNISTPVFSDHAITSAFGGSSRTFKHVKERLFSNTKC